MLKWLMLFALGYMAYRWLSRPSAPQPADLARGSGEPMLECAQCGVYFPRSEAVFDEDRCFCCDQHRASWKPGR